MAVACLLRPKIESSVLRTFAVSSAEPPAKPVTKKTRCFSGAGLGFSGVGTVGVGVGSGVGVAVGAGLEEPPLEGGAIADPVTVPELFTPLKAVLWVIVADCPGVKPVTTSRRTLPVVPETATEPAETVGTSQV